MNRIIAIIITLFSIANIHAQSYYIQCEDTCQHIHGIDISHYQGNVFWEAIGNNSKMYYVYLKATEGGDLIDAKYEQNIQLAHQYGLKVGSYHFYRARTPQEVQLRNFMAQCRPGEQDLVPMIDVETKSGLSNEAFRDSLSKFLILVEKKYKQKPLIYTGANFYDHYLSGGMLDDYKIMIAQYMAKEPVLVDGRDVTMWQYTGKGHINGVNGYIDKSRFMGDHKLREIRFRHH
ncbi:MAG: glycosyl hydrolase family 25 [Prevotella sp.]|nr:glycosyl hydrolase family 25 [Prevotella sp.]MBQ1626443.1 glycosyl hydrolase family 25 [Prevotella sp.]MBQ1667097.1 glycosyl hydrolase family 25 [Prevotella sp.]MBQ1702580.1 glycosyl hydrolase family 25 [Prevotella sp.]MBQ2345027.1 glycosyl hydrolase family 25 [Prevotella sp.]